MANYSQARRQAVYLSWKHTFSQPANYNLRKRKKIEAVVDRVSPYGRLLDTHLVKILQSLLDDFVFANEFAAAKEFPTIFPPGPGSGQIICTQKSVTQSDEMVGPTKELLEGLKALYKSGEYSDLTICCAGKNYRVHKVVICSQSSYFATMCRSGFKEAIESKIELLDDDPEVINMMIQYFYCLDYDAAASKGEQAGSLLTHSKIYALAEMYYIAGLKTLALQKFQQAASTTWTISDIMETAPHAYSSTVADDRGIRDEIVRIIHENADLLNNEVMQNVLRKLGSLSLDLLMFCHKQHKS